MEGREWWENEPFHAQCAVIAFKHWGADGLDRYIQGDIETITLLSKQLYTLVGFYNLPEMSPPLSEDSAALLFQALRK